ncbi:phosphotransferase [Streptomyces sp. NBC_00841]|uniref:phosphotransferase n=1 Tax=Streptomyces sp. NBC_00841 TaxID=2975847 RepID=UPI002DDAD72E|nr:phosphotransferase [Streptomyces sp. NBC_00841]
MEQAEFEHRWLPQPAPVMPVAVPETIALGRPVENCPWPWAVGRWADGEHPADGRRDVSLLGHVAGATREVSDTSGFISRFFRTGCDPQLYERSFADEMDPLDGGCIDRIDAGYRRPAGRRHDADGCHRDHHSSRRRAGSSLRDRTAGDR